MVGMIRTKKIDTTNKMADDSSVFSVPDVNIVQAVSDVERIMNETIAALDLHDAEPPAVLPALPPSPPPEEPAAIHKEVVEKLVNDIDPPEVRKPEVVKPDSTLVRLVKIVDQACNSGFWCKPPKKVLTSTP